MSGSLPAGSKLEVKKHAGTEELLRKEVIMRSAPG
jgi:hypothetical protein